MSNPTREEAIAEQEQLVFDILHQEFTELGQVDEEVVNYLTSRINNTFLREEVAPSNVEVRFELFFILEEFIQQIFVPPPTVCPGCGQEDSITYEDENNNVITPQCISCGKEYDER